MVENKEKFLKEMLKEAEEKHNLLQEKLEPLMIEMRKGREKINLIHKLLAVEGGEIGEEEESLMLNSEIVSGEKAREKIIEILKEYPSGLHYRKIYEELENRVYKMKGKEPAYNLLAHMSNDKEERFESLGKGMWRLREGIVDVE